MITYISLAFVTITAILGVLFKPTRRRADGREEYSPWIALFVTLPIIGFGIGAWNNYQKGQGEKILQSKQETLQQNVQELVQRRAHDQKLIGQLNDQVGQSSEVIEKLRGQIVKLSRRASNIEVSFIYAFDATEAKLSTEFTSASRAADDASLRLFVGNGGERTYGLSTSTLDLNFDEHKKVYDAANRALNAIRIVDPFCVILAKRTSTDDLLTAVRASVVTNFLGQTAIDSAKLPTTAVRYCLENPRLSVLSRPAFVASAQEEWAVRNKHADPLKIELLWNFKLTNDQSSDLASFDDFAEADAVVFIPRFNPKMDDPIRRDPIGSPFGEITDVQISVGNIDFKWSKAKGDSDEKTWHPRRKQEFLAQLVKLNRTTTANR